MTEPLTYGPLWLHDNDYPAQDHRLALGSVWLEGLLPPQVPADGPSFGVTQRAAGTNMSVDVAPGQAIVGDATSGSTWRKYLCSDPLAHNLTVTAGPPADSRIDLVVLQVNDVQGGGPAGNNAELQVLAGTPSGSPSPPSTPASALALATIGPITSSTTAITNAMIDTSVRLVAGRNAPTGTIEHLAGSTVPNGWLLADGREVSRTAEASLFAVIGTTYGAGNGTSTFNLPNLTGRVPVGDQVVPGQSAGATGGAHEVALSVAELAAHTHAVADHTHDVGAHAHTVDSHSHGMTHLHNITHAHGFPHSHDMSHGHSDTFALGVQGGAEDYVTRLGAYVMFMAPDDTYNPLHGMAVTNRPPGHGMTLTGGVIGHGGNVGSANPSNTNNYTGSSQNFVGNTAGAAPGTDGVGLTTDPGGPAATDSTGSGTAHENMPPYQVVGAVVIKA